MSAMFTRGYPAIPSPGSHTSSSQLVTQVSTSGMQLSEWYTAWSTNKKLLTMAIEIVELPIKNVDFPYLC